MDIKHYKVNRPERLVIEANGWRQGWHGYYRLVNATEHELKATMQERELEVDCLLNIVKDISDRGKTHINLIELGAGWGETCLSLAGIVNFKLIPHNIKSFNYLAVEAEPYYCDVIKKHFVMNDLPIRLLEAAVSNEVGCCKFNKFTSESSYYGQGITFGNFGGSKFKTIVLAGYHLLLGKTIKIHMTTIDKILDKHVDIIQCDVQGVEDRVIKGAMDSIKNHRVDYWLIGTHSKGLSKRCRELLSPYYNCIADAEPSKDKVMGLLQDGTQLYRRKGL